MGLRASRNQSALWLVAGLLAVAVLGGCGSDAGKSSGTPTETAATATPAAGGAANATAPAAAATNKTAAATAPSAGESNNVDAPAASTDSNLERALPLPAAGALPAGRWVAGTHYRVITPAQPTNAAPGKVEVLEMFWYGCPHCYAFDPFLESWRKNLPSYIEFSRMPAVISPNWRAHGKMYLTLEALGKAEALHRKVFDEIQLKHNALVGGDDDASLQAQQAYFKTQGISEADYAKAYNSFTVRTKMAQAEDLALRYRIDGVPAIIINGKYVTDLTMAGGNANLISVINDLAAAEKRR
jgi:thiol:disulfide interchange protein DsbA